jgi:hypothetical protein
MELQIDQQNMQKLVKEILFERCETELSNRQLESLQATAAKIVFEYGYLTDFMKRMQWRLILGGGGAPK